jgi:acetylornithine/N-succinyldiaminopimelate aminotransferase
VPAVAQSTPALPDDESSSVMNVYRRSDVCMVAGEGVWLTDANGKRYLDFASGIAVNSLGHKHPRVQAALHAQADLLWHCSNHFTNEHLPAISARLCDLSEFAQAVFFSSSGAEANEAAIKFIRRTMWHRKPSAGDTNTAERYRIISMKGGFHGRSLANIAACKADRAVEGFGPLPDGFDQVPFNDIAALEAAISPRTAAILLEPVQGEGGVHAHSAEYLQAARALADKHGIFLWLDEVQCGMGRTGTLFAYEEAGIVPDIVTIAKGLGNGFPIGATLVNGEIARAMPPGSHGSTFGSNPLALTVARTVLEELASPTLLANVRARAATLSAGLQELVATYPDLLADARGVGLMQGLQTRISAPQFMKKLRDAGLLVVAAGDSVVRILPPLIISDDDVAHAVSLLHQTCKEWQ